VTPRLPPLDVPAALVQSAVRAVAPVIEASVDPATAIVQATIRAVAPMVEALIDAIAAPIEARGRVVPTRIGRPIRRAVEPIVYAITSLVQACFDAIAALVQSLFDPVTAIVEPLLDPVATLIQAVARIGPRARGREACCGEHQYSYGRYVPCGHLPAPVSLANAIVCPYNAP
jgi:phage-related protein